MGHKFPKGVGFFAATRFPPFLELLPEESTPLNNFATLSSPGPSFPVKHLNKLHPSAPACFSSIASDFPLDRFPPHRADSKTLFLLASPNSFTLPDFPRIREGAPKRSMSFPIPPTTSLRTRTFLCRFLPLFSGLSFHAPPSPCPLFFEMMNLVFLVFSHVCNPHCLARSRLHPS